MRVAWATNKGAYGPGGCDCFSSNAVILLLLMRGSRKFCQSVTFVCVCAFLVDERREDPNTKKAMMAQH